MTCPLYDQVHDEAECIARLNEWNAAADAIALAALAEYVGTIEGIETVGEQWLVPLPDDRKKPMKGAHETPTTPRD